MRAIDADALQKEYMHEHNGKRLMLIDVAPTIEPERKKGRWLPNPFDRAWDMCSVCGTGIKHREYGTNPDGTEWVTEYHYPFCPWCTSDMREGQDES